MRWIKNSKKGMAVLIAVAFMQVAGWQFGVSGTEAVFSETEVALENAVEASGGAGTVCYQTYSGCWWFGCSEIYRCRPYGPCESVWADDWDIDGSC